METKFGGGSDLNHMKNTLSVHNEWRLEGTN